MWYVYVLRSSSDGHYYVGMTSQGPQERLERHNAGRVRSTKGRRPFHLVYVEMHESSKSARQRERLFKSGAGRELLARLGASEVAEPASGG